MTRDARSKGYRNKNKAADIGEYNLFTVTNTYIVILLESINRCINENLLIIVSRWNILRKKGITQKEYYENGCINPAIRNQDNLFLLIYIITVHKKKKDTLKNLPQAGPKSLEAYLLCDIVIISVV